MSDEKKFEREDRYIVLKVSDLIKYGTAEDLMVLRLCRYQIDEARKKDNKPPLECVVVEKDWPEYEVVWGLIEKRVSTESPYAEGQRMFKDGVLLSDTWSSCSPANFANLGEVLRGWEDAKNGVHPES